MKLNTAIEKMKASGVKQVADRKNLIHPLEDISKLSKEIDENTHLVCKSSCGKKISCRISRGEVDLARDELGKYEILPKDEPHLPPLLRQVS